MTPQPDAQLPRTQHTTAALAYARTRRAIRRRRKLALLNNPVFMASIKRRATR